MLDPAHVEWSGRLFATMKDGGIWGVPRSGIIFQRQGEELVLTTRIPYTEELSVTPEQFDQQQQADFDVVKAHFEAAGIRVRDAA